MASQVAYNQRECWWFVCSVVEWGNFSNRSNQVPITPTGGGGRGYGPSDVRYGGYKQKYSYYHGTQGNHSNYFPTIHCGVFNSPGNATLGCGPSSFQGLLQHQFQSHGKSFYGKSFPSTSVEDFDKWLVAEVGVNGRPRIANYMGTCKVLLTDNSLTTGHGYITGANNFLKSSGSGLKMIGYYSDPRAYAGWDLFDEQKARLIVQNVGYAENPVVAEYFRGSVSAGHFSAIREYRNLWQGNVDVTVKTVDDYNASNHQYDRFWSLQGAWTLESGVFTLVNK